MNDEDLAATLESLADSLRHAQAVGHVNEFLLGEIVHDLADGARIDTTISQECSSGSVHGWINYRSRKIRLG